MLSFQPKHLEALACEQDSTLLAIVDFLPFLFTQDRELSLFVGMILAFEMVKGGYVAEGGVVLLALEGAVEDSGRKMRFGFSISLYGFSSLNHC